MAVTRARISQSQGYGGKSLESTWHLSLALRLLRLDLAANFKCQNSSIVVAIALAIYANLNGAISESRIHLQGIKHILELRPGGLMALCSSTPEVGNKIRRADLELALLAGTPTLFGPLRSPLPTPRRALMNDRRSLATLPHPLIETSPAIHAAMADVLVLCDYAGSAQLSAFQYQDLVISIFQRLVDFAPLGGERPPHSLDEVCQLGLLAFMITLLKYTQERPSVYLLLTNLLGACLDTSDDEALYAPATKPPSLYLWVAFIYAVSSPEYDQFCDVGSSVSKRIQSLANVLILETWEDVAAELSVYPWVAVIHDEPGKRLWDVGCK